MKFIVRWIMWHKVYIGVNQENVLLIQLARMQMATFCLNAYKMQSTCCVYTYKGFIK